MGSRSPPHDPGPVLFKAGLRQAFGEKISILQICCHFLCVQEPSWVAPVLPDVEPEEMKFSIEMKVSLSQQLLVGCQQEGRLIVFNDFAGNLALDQWKTKKLHCFHNQFPWGKHHFH